MSRPIFLSLKFPLFLAAIGLAANAVGQSAIAQPLPNQNGYAYYYEKVGDGEWEKVGVKLQNLGRKTYAEIQGFLGGQVWFGGSADEESIAQQLAIFQSNFQCDRNNQGSCEDQIGGYYGDFIFNANGDHWSSSVSQTTLENGVIVGVPERRSGLDSFGNPVTYRHATIAEIGSKQTRESVVLIGPQGVVRTADQIQSGEVRPVFVGGELQVEGELEDNFLLLDFDSNAINNVGKDVSLSGTLAGPGGMTFAGSGTTTLSGINTYRGATTIQEGTLGLGSLEVCVESLM